jgi:acyl-CoA synthetase (AMP-forming)/AMP-acid ligase II
MLAQPSLHELRPRLSRLRTGIMAGSICPVELMRRVESDLGIKELTICYGMTETSPISFETSPHGEHKRWSLRFPGCTMLHSPIQIRSGLAPRRWGVWRLTRRLRSWILPRVASCPVVPGLSHEGSCVPGATASCAAATGAMKQRLLRPSRTDGCTLVREGSRPRHSRDH